METINYRSFIILELEARKQRNPRYSLRTYADSLGISPSRLSQVIRGKAGVSVKKGREISFRLFTDEKQREVFITLVEAEHSKSPVVKTAAKKRLDELFSEETAHLSFEKFSMIRNWYHYSILELTELKQFKPSYEWVSNQLGIDLEETRKAVERLIELELLKVEPDRWMQSDKEMSTTNGISSMAVREHHKQVIARMLGKIDETPLEKRFLNSTTMAIDDSKIAEAKKYLTEFRERFCKQIQDSDEKNSVYCFSMQLFPLLEEIETEQK